MRAHVGAILLLIFFLSSPSHSEVLTPPYFNLASGSSISATFTCGVDSNPDFKELFCRLTGASADERHEFLGSTGQRSNTQIIQGQLCDFCVAEGSENARLDPSQVHSPQFAIDGTQKWWQSPPLSRGRDSRFNNVDLDVNLGQEFHVAYVYIKMANSPRPGVWVLERSTDDGVTWEPWQYFADSPSDCVSFFNVPASKRPRSDTEVICTTEFSKIVPLEDGEVAVSLVKDRPGSLNFTHSPELQAFTKATNIRLKLMRTKTLQGHLMLLQRQDPTVTRRYFYSIRDISIGGRCVCNGHADVCDKKDQFKLACDCKHNTCGDNCNSCCEPYVQKKWKPSTDAVPFVCEPCECYGHADSCVYDEEIDRLRLSVDIHGKRAGGGVCQNCRDNTQGVNCDECVSGYYRPDGRSLNDVFVCEPCVCDSRFTTGTCEDITGRCICKPQFTGPDCRECAFGYYDPPICRPCDCFLPGTLGQVCQVGGGQCPCEYNFAGTNCDTCAPGFWNFPDCVPCTCDSEGAVDVVCNVETGQCPCDVKFIGQSCDQCDDGRYSYPDCFQCDCDTAGTLPEICDKNSGQCSCNENIAGNRCAECAPGFFGRPDCNPCNCDTTGTVGGTIECDDNGQCPCLFNFGSKQCSSCAPGFHNYPECKDCSCYEGGSFGLSCGQLNAECDCKSRYSGLKCDFCAPDYYNFPRCEACLCNPAGALPVPGYPLGGCGSHNDGYTLCECKENVFGHICDQCRPGFHNLQVSNPQGCEDCNCHLPGTLLGENMCDPVTGQCMCKVNVNSDKCQACIPGTYNLLESSVFGCEDCDCDVGGALHGVCNDTTGQCVCRPRIVGPKCNKPLKDHYFPTLHQLKYEFEEGRNPQEDDSDIRFGFDDSDFPDFSGKGFAIFSRIQPKVELTVDVNRASVFRLILRYMNRNRDPVNAELTVSPQDEDDEEQKAGLTFDPTGSTEPDFLTTDTSFVLNRGTWMVTLETEENLDMLSDQLLVDYLVLLPQPYYEGAVLQDKIRQPCMIPDTGDVCIHYTYVNLDKFNKVPGGNATANDAKPILETNRDILLPLDMLELAQLDGRQPELVFDITVPKAGPYVIVVEYLSLLPDRDDIAVSVQVKDDNATLGKAVFYECAYSSLCRQVVMDMDTGDKFINVPDVFQVILTASNNTIASIGSISAIPLSQWEDEIIKPEIMCVREKGDCTDGAYPLTPNSLRVEVGTKDDLKPDYIPSAVNVKKLDDKDGFLVSFTDVPTETYKFVVSYYQPEDLGSPINVTVDVNEVTYSGYFDAGYCPNTAGCYSIIQFDDILIKSEDLEVISKDVTLTLKPMHDDADLDVWIDFVQMIPKLSFDNMAVTMMKPFDLAQRYLAECTNENYYIDPEMGSITPFCRSAIFSVTTDYNNGALPCDCDAQGSFSFQCSEFGGQCRCKPNVIGRTCDACAQNYFGFPNCLPCDCPATCNAETGACECPKRVTGPLCDQCEPQTFGYDRTIGCTDCKCRAEGVLNSNLNCDADSGKCDCKPNIVGRKCDACVNGFWNYPNCQDCNCDPAGVSQGTCDSQSSECLCKTNTEGPACADCNLGTYNLEASNPDGCTKCFCFGITSTCQSSDLIRDTVMNMTGWGLINVNGTADIESENDLVIAMVSGGPVADESTLYWMAPLEYLGNKLTAYGGMITYTVNNTDIPADMVVVEGADIILQGKDEVIVYELIRPILDVPISVDLIETRWLHADTAAEVTREQFMSVLVQVEALYIKALYYEGVRETTLNAVSLDIAKPVPAGDVDSGGFSSVLDRDFALAVELCQCPSSYRGLSCEECADGFYRKVESNRQFACVPCECNGNSDQCDRETGICMDCQNNTEGDDCERCRAGFTMMQGVCVQCSCPLPVASNNFANTCIVGSLENPQTIQCDCVPGYHGALCGECAPGFYGNPNDMNGGHCMPCECNGNIDMSDNEACGKGDGNCLKCLNNTQGSDCGECEDMYWGDAVEMKNCSVCDCDPLGTDYCEKSTGECMCRPNVVGDRCDQCAQDTWGIALGKGCLSCNCSIASVSTQCNVTTGICDCQPGSTGTKCSSCLPQHWDFTNTGCKSCGCEMDGAVGCNVDTGICTCLHGVTGDKCDRCENRFVLIPDEGCQACDNCVHTLLDDTDSLLADILNASTSLNIINIGVEAQKRLQKINETRVDLEDQLNNLPEQSIARDELDKILQQMRDLQSLAASTVTDANKLKTDASLAHASYLEALGNLNTANSSKADVIDEINETLAYIQMKYDDIVSQTEVVNADGLLAEAQIMVDSMLNDTNKLKDKAGRVEEVYDEAVAVTAEVNEFETKSDDLMDKFKTLSDQLNDTMNRLNDLLVKAEAAVMESKEVENLLKEVKDLIDDLKANTVSIASATKEISEKLNMASDLKDQAADFLKNSAEALVSMERNLTVLEVLIDGLNEFSQQLLEDNIMLGPHVRNAREHAENLTAQANDLVGLLRDTQEASDAAVQAANAYRMIVQSINNALNASRNALDDAEMAIKMLDEGICCGDSTDIKNNTEQVKIASDSLLNRATAASNRVSNDLTQRLEDSRKTIDGLALTKLAIEQNYNEALFAKDPITGLGDAAQELSESAAESKQRAEDAIESVQEHLNVLDNDKERITKIPEYSNKMDVHLLKVRTKLETISEKMPSATSIQADLQAKKPALESARENIASRIEALKQKIQVARSTANRVKVAMKSHGNTTVELRQPKGFVEDMMFESQFELYFTTAEPNGMLLYVGPKATSNAVEFLALELEAGRVVWTYNLGDGEARIQSNNSNYNDGKWHRVKASRARKLGMLEVSTQQEDKLLDDVSDGSTGGEYNQLDLSVTGTKIYAAGVPANFTLPPAIKSRNFIGGLDDITYSEAKKPLGLWNFVAGEENGDGILNRGEALTEPASDSVTFGADSFLQFDEASLNAGKKIEIDLKFTTLNSDGLLFFIGQDLNGFDLNTLPDYFKIYLKDGKVTVEFNLGAGPILATVDEPVADGREHAVFVYRVDNVLEELTVDGKAGNPVEGNNQAKGLNLGAEPEIYLGAIPKDSAYYGTPAGTFDNYEGCMRGVAIDGITWDLAKAKTVGTVAGCNLEKKRVTFTETDDGSDGEGYVHLVGDVVSVSDNFTLGMSIKTLAPDALLFYTSDEDDKYAFSVALVDGKVMVLNTAGENGEGISRQNAVQTAKIYNDGDWHSFDIVKEGLLLKVLANEIETVESLGEHRGRKTRTDIAFGYYLAGLPQNVQDVIVNKDLSPTWKRFVGCMRDVTIENFAVDFRLSMPIGANAEFSTCPVPDPIDPADTTTADTTTADTTTADTTTAETTTAETTTAETTTADTTTKAVAAAPTTQSDEPSIPIESSLNPRAVRGNPVTKPPVTEPPVTEPPVTEPPVTEPPVTEPLVTEPPVTESPTPPPEPTCALPASPDMTNAVEAGTRFGLTEYSRIEYSTFAGVATPTKKLRLNNNVQLKLKTYSSDGIIWFVGDAGGDNPDYSIVYLNDGRVVYQNNLGSGSASVTSDLVVNDGQWHTVEFQRVRRDGVVSGYLKIDDDDVQAMDWPSGATSLSYSAPIYIGGLDETETRYAYMQEKLGKPAVASLMGCIQDILYREKGKVDWQPYGAPTVSESVQPCFGNQEGGVFIPETGGTLDLGTQVKVGMSRMVEVSVRPRSRNGVIFLVYGGGDYLGIELVDGRVVTNMNNGAGDVEVSIEVADICDGSWKVIKVDKVKNLITVSVQLEDGSVLAEDSSSGPATSTSADTRSPITIGGLPSAGTWAYTPKSTETYIGCIRGVKLIEYDRITNFGLSRGIKSGDVDMSCPTN